MELQSNERSHLPARGLKPLKLKPADVALAFDSLDDLGISFEQDALNNMYEFATSNRGASQLANIGAMDADFTAPLTTASVTTPVQFLQAWLPGFVEVITAVRRIDELTGITTQGSWEDEEVVQGVMEYTGNARIYSDSGNVPQTSWNVNYIRYTNIRFEEGMEVGRLQEARAARIRVNTAESKRMGAVNALEIARNRVGFFGYNDGDGRTYGYFNTPGLPAYTNVPNGAGGSSGWSTKTYLEIIADIREALQSLRTNSRERVDPKMDMICLAVATSAVDYLTVVSQFGNSVMEWLNKNYPNVMVKSAPELDAANGAQNVFYMYAETVRESGSDDMRTFTQVVPQKFRSLGVDQKTKSYEEAYSNATAGVILKRPYALVRRSGI